MHGHGSNASACGGGCKGCKALNNMAIDHGLSAWQFSLGIVWVFLLPILGLIVGAILADRWESRPWLAALALCGGLVAGVAAGVIGRRLTLHPDATVQCEGYREKHDG